MQEFHYPVPRSEAEVEIDAVLLEGSHGRKLWFDVKSSQVKAQTPFGDASEKNEQVLRNALDDVLGSILADESFASAVCAVSSLKDRSGSCCELDRRQ